MLWVVTPTDARPEAFGLLERWLAAQEWPDPFAWIVATHDAAPYRFTMGQAVIEHPLRGRLHPLCSNLLAALDALDLEPEDLVLICEDDDAYLPGYFRRAAELAGGVSLSGQTPSRYYNVATRRCHELPNTDRASLCQTAFRADVVHLVRSICRAGRPWVDRALWRHWSGARRLGRSDQHVGIKGMPGAKGVGVGHREGFGRPDHGGRVFRAWGVPEAYRRYASVAELG